MVLGSKNVPLSRTCIPLMGFLFLREERAGVWSSCSCNLLLCCNVMNSRVAPRRKRHSVRVMDPQRLRPCLSGGLPSWVTSHCIRVPLKVTTDGTQEVAAIHRGQGHRLNTSAGAAARALLSGMCAAVVLVRNKLV